MPSSLFEYSFGKVSFYVAHSFEMKYVIKRFHYLHILTISRRKKKSTKKTNKILLKISIYVLCDISSNFYSFTFNFLRKPITAKIGGNSKKYNCHDLDYTHPVSTFAHLALGMTESVHDLEK